MKDYQELLASLRIELEQWFIKQCRNNFEDYYLYYIETTPEHDGGIIICAEQPANKEYKLAWNQTINKGATVEQNFNNLVNNVMERLPVLSIY